MQTSFVRALILALALTTGAMRATRRALFLRCSLARHRAGDAVSAPTAKLNVKAGSVGSGLKMDSIKGDVEVESSVNENLSVGVNVANGENPLRAIFGKFNQK
jgi:hypothetical protein